MARTLKIAVSNANGLLRHSLELKAFLYSRNIDIMLISETHFTDKNYINIHNYKIYHTLHPDRKAHGGTAVIIKNKLKHHESSSYQQEHIQATSIAVEDWAGEIIVTAIYSPPKHIISKHSYTEFFNTLGNRFLVAGDFNAKHTYWRSRLTQPKRGNLMMAMDHSD